TAPLSAKAHWTRLELEAIGVIPREPVPPGGAAHRNSADLRPLRLAGSRNNERVPTHDRDSMDHSGHVGPRDHVVSPTLAPGCAMASRDHGRFRYTRSIARSQPRAQTPSCPQRLSFDGRGEPVNAEMSTSRSAPRQLDAQRVKGQPLTTSFVRC